MNVVFFQTELIKTKGYPCQEYNVVTQDGYVLGVQRIPQGHDSVNSKQHPVVLLQHGLLGSSSNWVSNLRNESFGAFEC